MNAFGVGVPEIIVIFVIALVVFGPGKLPEIGSGIGRAVREFRKATSEITSEFTREMGTAEQTQPSGSHTSATVATQQASQSGDLGSGVGSTEQAQPADGEAVKAETPEFFYQHNYVGSTAETTEQTKPSSSEDVKVEGNQSQTT